MPLGGGAPTLLTELFDALGSVAVQDGRVYFGARDDLDGVEAIFTVSEDCTP
jgi:hypothetical protein